VDSNSLQGEELVKEGIKPVCKFIRNLLQNQMVGYHHIQDSSRLEQASKIYQNIGNSQWQEE
jgi:hypothetical protein